MSFNQITTTNLKGNNYNLDRRNSRGPPELKPWIENYNHIQSNQNLENLRSVSIKGPLTKQPTFVFIRTAVTCTFSLQCITGE